MLIALVKTKDELAGSQGFGLPSGAIEPVSDEELCEFD
jgi:hypothetical protein